MPPSKMLADSKNKFLKKSSLASSVTSFQDQETQCPICKSDRYLTPNLKLLMSRCFHKMCESCIDRLFSAGPAPCPECSEMLRKNEFRTQIFEDVSVEKEIRIREKISKIYNKRADDFKSLRFYNDYLELVEKRIFNLIHNVDADKTEKEIEQYEKENKETIVANEALKSNESAYFKYQQEMEKKDKLVNREMYMKQLEEEKMERESEKKGLIKELATAAIPAQRIIANRQSASLKRSSALKQQNELSNSYPSRSNNYIPSWLAATLHSETIKEKENMDEFEPLDEVYEEPTGYKVLESYHDLITESNVNKKESRAGGYSVRFGYERALMEAFSGIFFDPSEQSVPAL